MTSRVLAPVFDGVRAVLLDFDGPVTALMPAPANRRVADGARAALADEGASLPEPVRSTSDHLAVLRWAGEHSPGLVAAVERACVRGELEAARGSTLTLGVREFLAACRRAGVPVVVVSNNAAVAVEDVLERHELLDYVRAVHGRPPGRPDLMKPAPHLVAEALAGLRCRPDDAVLIGDSVSDVVVATSAGVRSIGYAKHDRRIRELEDAGADFIVESMAVLTAAG